MISSKELIIRSDVLKNHIKRYISIWLLVSLLSIILATMLTAYKLTGSVGIYSWLVAQQANPALWVLDVMPLVSIYWGRAFIYELAYNAETIIDDTARGMAVKSDTLEVQLMHAMSHDDLTQLPNQNFLFQRIQQCAENIQIGEHMAVILLKPMNFKEFNYQYGAAIANALLVQFATFLKTILLEPELLQVYMGMNMVARLQGSDFIVFLPRLRKEHNLDAIVQKILTLTSRTFTVETHELVVQTRAGIALYPEHGVNAEALVHNATLSILQSEQE